MMEIHQTGASAASLARQQQVEERFNAIMSAPEATARRLVAYALLLRVDLSAEYVVMFLREAPDLCTPADIWAWAEGIPRLAQQETMQ